MARPITSVTLDTGSTHYSGLIGLWEADNDHTTVFYGGLLGTHGDGVFVGDTNIATTGDDYGAVCDFDGSGDYCLSTNFSFFETCFNNTDDTTLSVWFKVDTLPSAAKGIVAKARENSASYPWWSLGINSSNEVIFDVSGVAGADQVTLNLGAISAGTYYLATITRSGTSLQGFLNGSLVDSATASVDASNDRRFVFGANEAGVEMFDGKIVQIALYDRVPLSSEVAEWYDADTRWELYGVSGGGGGGATIIMAAPIGNPKFHADDNDGNPLVGGKLHTYAPGTTTNKATYTDASLSVANANPIILDSRGEASVWPDGATKYVLKDADDNTIWTMDSVGEPEKSSHSFRAHKNGTDQSGIASATQTKLTFTTESFDKSGWYDAANSKYTPQIEGVYRIRVSALCSAGMVDQSFLQASIYKNGSLYESGFAPVSGTVSHTATVDCLVEMNGSTDYVEVYFLGGGAGSKTISGDTRYSVFSGSLVEIT